MLKRLFKNIAPLLIIIAASLFVRIALPYDKIFTDVGIKFSGVDAYYHMRIVDNLVANFPHLTFYDPYYILPNGTILAGQHFFDWLLAGVIWLIGVGHPSQHLVDVVGVYFPAVLGALAVIPVYFIGKSIFNKYVGLIASVLVAVFAGDFLGRSMLGATDHHVAEVLFSTIAVLCVLLAIQTTNKRRLVIYSALAGLFLGIYLLTWAGGLLFVLIISGYFVIQSIINHNHHEPELNFIGTIVFPIVLLMNYSELPRIATYVLVLASLLPLVLYGLSRLTSKMATIVYPIVLAAVIAGVSLLMFKDFSIFLSSGSSVATTSELQPLFSVRGNFTLSGVWGNYTTSWFLFPISFLIFIWVYVNNKTKLILFLLLWTFIMVVLTLIQRRYAYYLTINVAILMGFLCYYVYQWINGLIKPKKTKKNKTVKKGYAVPMLMIIVVFLVVVLPNFTQDKITTNVAYAPSDAWQSALLWLEDNSPQPFGGKEVYYTEYPLNPDNVYIKPDYAVTSWWDYGYWISRTAHRVPNDNPAQSIEPIKKVASLLLSDGEPREILVEFKTKYLMLDWGLLWQKFTAVGEWIGKPSDYYIGLYYVENGNQYTYVYLFSPEYYKTLAVRLYNFDGKAVSPKTTVITYVVRNGVGKVITSSKVFSNYEEAQAYAQKVSGIIVGTNPFISPIPLEPVSDFRLIYSSKQVNSPVDNVPEVKILEYLGGS